MTQPLSPDSLTYQEALAIAASAQAAASAPAPVTATLLQASAAVIQAREVAAEYAKALILGLWGSVDPYDGRAVQAFTEQARGHMANAQTATARAAAAGQAQILSAMGVKVPGVPSNPVDVRAPGAEVVNGQLVLQRPAAVSVDYETRESVKIAVEDSTTQAIFNRPARAFRALEAEGASKDIAEEAARDRIELLIEDNLMLAQRFAELEIVQTAADLDQTVIGYRRVIHPELSRTGVCGLCIAAADRHYTVGTLLPIHDRCKCTVAAVTESHDPADDVNAADLGALYGQAGGTGGAALKRVRYQVDEHGELGPTLVPKKKYKPRTAGSKRRTAGAGDAPDASQVDTARRLLPGLQDSLKDQRAQGLSEDSPQVTYHKAQIDRWQSVLVKSGALRK